MSGEGWVYVGAPRDVAQALMDRAWDDDVSDDMRILLELGSRTINDSLDRNVRLAQVIEGSEVGL